MKIKNKFSVQLNNEPPMDSYNTMLYPFYNGLFNRAAGDTYIELYEDGTEPDVFEVPKAAITWGKTDQIFSGLIYDDELHCHRRSVSYEFGLSSAVGRVIRSVGVKRGGVVTSRALITDQNGNPIEIHKTELDKITITYTIYIESEGDNLYLTNSGLNNMLSNGLSVSNTRKISLNTSSSASGEPVFAEGTYVGRLTDEYGTIVNSIDHRRYTVGPFDYRLDLANTGYRIENEVLTNMGHDRCYQQKFFGCFDEVVKINGQEVPKTEYTIEPMTFSPYFNSKSYYYRGSTPYMCVGPNVILEEYKTRYGYVNAIGNPILTTYVANQHTVYYMQGYIEPDSHIVLRNDTVYDVNLISIATGTDIYITIYGSNDGINYEEAVKNVYVGRLSGGWHHAIDNGKFIPINNTYKYFKITSSSLADVVIKLFTTPQNVDNIPGTIIFNEAPLSSDVVTIDYTTRSIPKTIENVVDFTFTLRVE